MTRNNRTNFNVLDNDDDALCCCQYVNERGQRSHLAGLLCDCQEVDDAFDRFCRGSLSSTSVPDSSTTLGCILDVVEDRSPPPKIDLRPFAEKKISTEIFNNKTHVVRFGGHENSGKISINIYTSISLAGFESRGGEAPGRCPWTPPCPG